MNTLVPVLENSPELAQKNNVLQAVSEISDFEVWLADFNNDNTSPTYRKGVEQFAETFNIQTLDDLKAVSNKHIVAFKKLLVQKGRANGTVNNRLSAVSSFYNYLIEQGILNHNPAVGIRRMKNDRDRVKSICLTPQEGGILMESPEGDGLQALRDRAILYVLFFTGCRESEICKLQVRDFFSEQGYFILDFKVKGGKRNRVAIQNTCADEIQRYVDASKHGWNKDSSLFLTVKNKYGAPPKELHRQTIISLWKKYALKVGLVGTSPHSARTTFITTALKNNCPIEHVQETVSHARTETTKMYDKREVRLEDSASFAVRYPR